MHTGKLHDVKFYINLMFPIIGSAKYQLFPGKGKSDLFKIILFFFKQRKITILSVWDYCPTSELYWATEK